MRNVIAEISNVRRLRNAAHTLLHQSRGARIALVSGAVGLGKTTATRHICLVEDAIWIEALPDWTPRWMTADIAEELGCARAYSTEKNFRAIIGALKARTRAVFIDEADRLCEKLHLAETLRAIHDQTAAPLILIGMAKLPKAARLLPQLESRVSHWVEFQPCDLRDARMLADELCEVELADDLVKQMHQAARGSVREIETALGRIEMLARRKTKRRLALDDLPEGFDLIFSQRRRAADRAEAPLEHAKEDAHAAA